MKGFFSVWSVVCSKNISTFASGKRYTACSFRIPQGLTAARVEGCSGAMFLLTHLPL